MTIRPKRVVKSVWRQLAWAEEPFLNLNQSMGGHGFDSRPGGGGTQVFFLSHVRDKMNFPSFLHFKPCKKVGVVLLLLTNLSCLRSCPV